MKLTILTFLILSFDYELNPSITGLFIHERKKIIESIDNCNIRQRKTIMKKNKFK